MCADITDSREGYNVYSIPVKINGTKMLLRASYDYAKDAYTILDAFETMDSESGTAGKSRPMQEGDEVTFLFQRTSNTSDAVEEVELDTITWHDGIKMVDEDLGDGSFAYCFRITDVFGKTQTTDKAIVIYENGEIWLETMDEWTSGEY